MITTTTTTRRRDAGLFTMAILLAAAFFLAPPLLLGLARLGDFPRAVVAYWSFADLIILPILNIYRKYYGWKMTLFITGACCTWYRASATPQ